MASVAKRKWNKPDGTTGEKWIVRYVDRGGAHRQETFAKKKDADARRTAIETELGDGTHIARGAGRTVAEVADLFEAEFTERARRGSIRPASAANYREHLRLYVVPRFGRQLVHEIETIEIEQWLADLHRGGALTSKSIAARLLTLKMLIDFAIRHRSAKINPVAAVRRDLKGGPGAKIKTFSTAQVRALLVASGTRPPRHSHRAHLMLQCYVMLGAFCGLRRGEINGLQARYVDLDGQQLAIRHSLDRFGNLQPPKTKAGWRDIMLPEPLTGMLRAWLREYGPAGEEGYVFTTRGGEPMHRQNFLRDIWHPLLVRANLFEEEDTYHFHALRHFAGSWMLDSGWSIPDVSLALGHTNPSITMGIYAHSLAKRSQSLGAMNALADRLLSGDDAAPALVPALRACAPVAHGALTH